MRTYRCTDCPPKASEHTAGARGPLPARCPAHRRARDLRRERRGRSSLRVVQPGETLPVPPPAEEVLVAVPDARQVPPGTVQEALREDLAQLFSKHPAARTLERIAGVLALVLDSPAALVADPRIVPPLSRELRAVIQDLTSATKAEEDDLFGGAGPVVVGA